MRKKFDYRWIPVTPVMELDDRMGRLGEDGWELVAGDSGMLFFMRERPGRDLSPGPP